MVQIDKKTGIKGDITETMGRTPIVELREIENYFNSSNDLIAKLEYFNPGGSIKDRIGREMIQGAQKENKIKPGGVIIEPTSGNTGVGLALASKKENYKTVFTMPSKMSKEKELLLKSIGGHVIRTPTQVEPEDPNSYYNAAEAVKKLIWTENKKIREEKLKEIVNYIQELIDTENLEELRRILDREVEANEFAYMPNQYYNKYNPLAHKKTTAKEILRQTKGDIDYLFAGMGTGGTITGIGEYLKDRTNLKIIGVDPRGSIFSKVKNGMNVEEAKNKAETYLTEGIGEDLIPDTTNLDIIDEMIEINDQESFSMTRLLTRKEGIFGGGSSGSALYGALKYLKTNNIEDKNVLMIFPDTGRNYLTRIFNDDWMKENDLKVNDEEVLEELR